MNIFSKEMLYASSSGTVFVRPNLTKNGTLGRSAFAVSASSQYSNDYAAYKAVDSNTTITYWVANNEATPYFIFYNPEAINVTQLTFKFRDLYKGNPDSLRVSNNGSSWTYISVTTTTPTSTTTVMNCSSNTNFYKYYKIGFSSASQMCLLDLQITATIE